VAVSGRFAFLLADSRGFSHTIHVADSAGGGVRQLTSRRALGRPAFSPDGARVVFPGPLGDDSDGRFGLFSCAVDGSDLRRLTSPAVADHDPAWSPDGRTIAFAREIAGAMNPANTRLYLMPAGGGAQSQRTSVLGARSPAWSPDGTTLLFVDRVGALYRIGADGRDQQVLIPNRARTPTWSPDGRTIAFVQRLSADRSRLVTLPASGGQGTVFADLGGQVEDPVWASDSRTLYALSYRGQGWEGRQDAVIVRVRSGAPPERVLAMGERPLLRLSHHPDPPPGLVEQLLAEVTQRTVRLTWRNPADADLAGVEVRMATGPTPPESVTAGTRVYAGRLATVFLTTGIDAATTYSFSVFARDLAGNVSGPVSTTVTTPPPRQPDPPAFLEAVPGDRRARAAWDPPLNDGGRPITSYTVNAPTQTLTVAADARSALVTGLAPGRSHVLTVVAHNELGPSAPATVTVVPDTGHTAGTLSARSPQRLLDTRATGGAVQAGADRSVPVLGRAGVPETGVAAVGLTLTVTRATSWGHLTVYPSGTPRPGVSSLNYRDRETVSNTEVVPVGADGAITLSVPTGAAHVVADVTSVVASRFGPVGGRLNAITPTRLLDTRRAGGALAARTPRVVQVSGAAGLPASGAGSVVLIVTCVAASALTSLVTYPAGSARPSVGGIACPAGGTKAALVTVPLPADGRVAFYSMDASTHLVVDVLGWYTQDGEDAGELLNPLAPARILDTRSGLGAPARALLGEEVLPVMVRGRGGVPEGARSVLLNLTAVLPTAATHLTVYPADRLVVPGTSVLNAPAGRTVANLVLAKLGADGAIRIRNAAGEVDVVADVRAAFTTT
jgi:hypothetical protein